MSKLAVRATQVQEEIRVVYLVDLGEVYSPRELPVALHLKRVVPMLVLTVQTLPLLHLGPPIVM